MWTFPKAFFDSLSKSLAILVCGAGIICTKRYGIAQAAPGKSLDELLASPHRPKLEEVRETI